MADRRPRTIAIDFDGVLHLYSSGWTGVEPTDDPVPGAQRFMERLIKRGYTPVVYSARALEKDGVEEIRLWLAKHDFPRVKVTSDKIPALLYLDDRGLRFEGDFDEVMAFIDQGDLDPWHKAAERGDD